LLSKNVSQIFSSERSGEAKGELNSRFTRLFRKKTGIPLMIIISVEIALVFSAGFLSTRLSSDEDAQNGKIARGQTSESPHLNVGLRKPESQGTRLPGYPALQKSGFSDFAPLSLNSSTPVANNNDEATSHKPPKAAIIIDDFGNHTETAYDFLNLDGPLNCSFLPKRPFTKKSIELAKQKGHQIMLHLPMEPYRSHITNPGKLAVWTYMTDEEIRKTVIEALDAVPGASGADNHMGSKGMEDERVLTAVLKVFKERNLFFIDSETTSKTVLNKVAKNFGVKTRANRVFLDNKKELSYVLGRIKFLGDIAIRNGEVIGIGHVNTVTALALKVGIPVLKRRGIQLVTVSELMR